MNVFHQVPGRLGLIVTLLAMTVSLASAAEPENTPTAPSGSEPRAGEEARTAAPDSTQKPVEAQPAPVKSEGQAPPAQPLAPQAAPAPADQATAAPTAPAPAQQATAADQATAAQTTPAPIDQATAAQTTPAPAAPPPGEKVAAEQTAQPAPVAPAPAAPPAASAPAAPPAAPAPAAGAPSPAPPGPPAVTGSAPGTPASPDAKSAPDAPPAPGQPPVSGTRGRALKPSPPPTGRNALGVTAGLASGFGVGYRRYVTEGVALRVEGLIYASSSAVRYSVGLTGQEDFLRTLNYRLYALEGLAVHHPGPGTTAFAPGAGVGFEYDMGGLRRGIAFRVELVLTALVGSDGLILFTPLPQVGALYVF